MFLLLNARRYGWVCWLGCGAGVAGWRGRQKYIKEGQCIGVNALTNKYLRNWVIA